MVFGFWFVILLAVLIPNSVCKSVKTDGVSESVYRCIYGVPPSETGWPKKGADSHVAKLAQVNPLPVQPLLMAGVLERLFSCNITQKSSILLIFRQKSLVL